MCDEDGPGRLVVTARHLLPLGVATVTTALGANLGALTERLAGRWSVLVGTQGSESIPGHAL